jgi:hypothetical protein
MAPPRPQGQRGGKGSGLSLERFIQGKAHRAKADAKSKKKAIIHKAQRKRAYDKVKKQTTGHGADHDMAAADSTPTSFYDRFFSELKEDSTTGAKKVRYVDVSVGVWCDGRLTGGWFDPLMTEQRAHGD